MIGERAERDEIAHKLDSEYYAAFDKWKAEHPQYFGKFGLLTPYIANAENFRANFYRNALVEERLQRQLELKRFQAILERERTQVSEGVKAVKDILQQRDWLTEGRGPYAYDDDRWHSEFGFAIDEIREALKPLEKIAADLSDCPTTHDEVQAARAGWELEAAREQLTAVENILADIGYRGKSSEATRESAIAELAAIIHKHAQGGKQ